jgi:hypothetical protein
MNFSKNHDVTITRSRDYDQITPRNYPLETLPSRRRREIVSEKLIMLSENQLLPLPPLPLSTPTKRQKSTRKVNLKFVMSKHQQFSA